MPKGKSAAPARPLSSPATPAPVRPGGSPVASADAIPKLVLPYGKQVHLLCSNLVADSLTDGPLLA